VRLAAFDLSMTATGWARNIDPAPALGSPWESGILTSKHKGARRLWDLLHKVMRACHEDGPVDVAIIEGYAHGSKYQTHQTGELGGVIRLGFFQKDIPLVVVPPTKLKKFASGKGSHKKGETKIVMVGAAIRRLDYEGNSHDVADALWLLQMGLHHYKLPGAVPLPKHNLTALHDDVEWPVPELEF
jgi:Holliday junction resolvasome RuvABC endonuclease subunit